MATDLKVYDKIRALAGSYKMMHNDVALNTVIRDEEFLRGRREVDYSTQYFTIESIDNNNTITFIKGSGGISTPSPDNTFYYSTDDGQTWTSSNDTTSWTLNSGDKLLMKANATTWCNGTNDVGPSVDLLWRFTSTNRYNAYGNIMSLLYGDNFIGQTLFADGSWYNFAGLFDFSELLINASKLILPATTLAQRCYSFMFYGCTSLITAPELPATNLAQSCYNSMFQGCTSLVTAPDLPATNLAQGCYAFMFEGCTSLTTAPVLPATTLAEHCYENMFQRCTSLTTAPELPATTLASNCYNMMFYICSSLNYIKCLATDISASKCVEYWVVDVSSSGTFVKDASMTGWSIGDSGIPSGWTVVDAA